MGTEGLSEIFRAHRRRLEALARHITGDREEAADVVSDAFVSFLERGPRQADEAGAWLYVVTRNKARNRVRDRARAARRPLPAAEPVHNPAPLDLRVTELLARAADTLSARHARALEFRFRHGLDHRETAAALGISVAATRVLVHRATRRLRGETVVLLADHHGASPLCRAELLREAVHGRVRQHEGCSSCAAVAEEVHALAARGVFVLPVPIVDRVLDPLQRWVATRLPRWSGTPSPRAAEALAALVVSGALVLGGGSTPLPSASAPAVPATPLAVVPVPQGALERAVTLAAPAAGEAQHPVYALDDAVDVADAVDAGARHVVAFEDGANDAEGVADDVFSHPRLLGVPLLVPDVRPAGAGPASGDIRTLHVGTTADDSGAPAGLYFRTGLAGPPDGVTSYNVSFRLGDTPCSWSIWIYPQMDRSESGDERFVGTFDTSLSETCAPRTSEDETAGDAGFTRGMIDYAPYADDLAHGFSDGASSGFDKGYHDTPTRFPATISGRGVALEIPFSALNARHRDRVTGAEYLHGVVALASFDLAQDRLPDEDEATIDYRIERRP